MDIHFGVTGLNSGVTGVNSGVTGCNEFKIAPMGQSGPALWCLCFLIILFRTGQAYRKRALMSHNYYTWEMNIVIGIFWVYY